MAPVSSASGTFPTGDRLRFAQALAEELSAIYGYEPSVTELPEGLRRVYNNKLSVEDEAALNAIIHTRRGDKSLSALCLSGGGIRSATFALGVMQGLARRGLLRKFSYLSTVSGGGYIGSWLSAWIYRKAREVQAARLGRPINGGAPSSDEDLPPLHDSDIQQALERVTDELSGRRLDRVDSLDPPDRVKASTLAVAAESPPVIQLRRFSNYLAPALGIMSADFWSLIATILRNVILNWLVLIPVLLAALAVPRLLASAVYDAPFNHLALWLLPAWAERLGRGPQRVAWWLTVVGFGCCAWTVAYVNRKRVLKVKPRDDDASESKRSGQMPILLAGILPLWLAAIVLSIAWAWWHHAVDTVRVVLPMPGLTVMAFGAAVMLVGWLAYIVGRFLWRPQSIDPDHAPRGLQILYEFPAFVATGTLGGGILWIVASRFDVSTLSSNPTLTLIYAALAPPLFVLSFLLSGTILAGIGSRWMSEMDREWWSRFGAWGLISAVAWAAVSAVVLLLPHWLAGAWKTTAAATLTAGSGAVTILGGLSKKTLFTSRSEEPLVAGVNGATKKEKEKGRLLSTAVKIALPTFVVLFAVFLSLLTDVFVALYARHPFAFGDFVQQYLDGGGHLLLANARFNFVVAAAGVAVGSMAAATIGINDFSLHAMYRNRLIRAYLGASRGNSRNAEPFIGFDRDDDFALCTTASTGGSGRPLFHVVNMALNLVAGRELAWQERRAESLTATSLHVGTRRLGYRRAKEYAGLSRPNREQKTQTDNTAGTKDRRQPRSRRPLRTHSLTLGTAMAISGAAASPNMGYHSSPVLTFLMTLFNARLGWWLGNPGESGRFTYYKESPRWSLRPLFAEAFGQTDETHPYIYASDGGHFENLGLYEMVRRRCHFILVVDAGADPRCAFQDLSAAVGKIRADMGIPIELPLASNRYVFARSDDAKNNDKGKVAFVGRIRYSAVDALVDHPDEPMTPERAKEYADQYDGYLLYVKPAYYGRGEPLDVVHYATSHASFPHETTADQFFSESQFESYRALGMFAVQQICEEFDQQQEASLAQFKHSIEAYVKRAPQARPHWLQNLAGLIGTAH